MANVVGVHGRNRGIIGHHRAIMGKDDQVIYYEKKALQGVVMLPPEELTSNPTNDDNNKMAAKLGKHRQRNNQSRTPYLHFPSPPPMANAAYGGSTKSGIAIGGSGLRMKG